MPAADCRPSILYVVHRVPYPPDKGDRIRAFNILRFLARRANVYLACLADEPVPQETLAALQPYCARLAVVRLGQRKRWLWALATALRGGTISEGAFWSPELARVTRRWAWQTRFHAVLASASSVAPYLQQSELAWVPAVIDLVDVDSQKWLDYAAASRGPRALLYRHEGRRLRRLEESLEQWAQAATVVSACEAELLRPSCRSGFVQVVPNGVDLDYFQPAPWTGQENGCAFVGALDYRPNIDAACWFAREVWPAIHRRHADARLRLIGRSPVPEVCRLAEVAGVEVVGQVPDVRPHVAASAVVVAPLRIARGIQNKVLEGMAMSRPVVASPQALQGLAHSAAPTLLAASPDEWGEQVGALLSDGLAAPRQGKMGREYVERHHSWEECLAGLGALLGLESSSQSKQEMRTSGVLL